MKIVWANHIQDGVTTSVLTLISFQVLHCSWSYTKIIQRPGQLERRLWRTVWHWFLGGRDWLQLASPTCVRLGKDDNGDIAYELGQKVTTVAISKQKLLSQYRQQALHPLLWWRGEGGVGPEVGWGGWGGGRGVTDRCTTLRSRRGGDQHVMFALLISG